VKRAATSLAAEFDPPRSTPRCLKLIVADNQVTRSGSERNHGSAPALEGRPVQDTLQTMKPLVHLAGPHWPVIVTWPEDAHLETVPAPNHADAIRAAANIYKGAANIQVSPIPVTERISAPADPDPDAPPVIAQFAQALLASHAPEYTVVPVA
jgi:hypothetical protein